MDTILPGHASGTPSGGPVLHSPHRWPGRPAPVLALVDDTLAAVAATRWATRSAVHRATDVALLVVVPNSTEQPSPAVLDDAMAVVGRVLPTVARGGGVAHPLLALVPRSGSARALRRSVARVVADTTHELGAPLVVAPYGCQTPIAAELVRAVDADVLLVPALQTHGAAAVGT